MNNKFIRRIYLECRDNYNLELLSYSPITSKSFKVLSKNNEKYIIKKSKEKVKNKYMFLKNEGIDNIIYPLFNNSNLLLNRLTNNPYCDDCFYVLPYYEDKNVLNEKKANDLLNELIILHNKTKFYRKLSIVKSKDKVEQMISFLDYQFSSLEAYIRTIEASKYDEFSIPILKNYQYILKAKEIMFSKNKKIVKAIKEQKSVMFCFLHNNPKLDHLINYNGNKYLISIDNGVIGIPSLDIAKFYIENEDIYFDISVPINNYLETLEDEFYKDYFVFIVLFMYMKCLIIDTKGYISTQSFIFVANSIKKFTDSFFS